MSESTLLCDTSAAVRWGQRLAVFLAVLLLWGGLATAPTFAQADVQIIHNSGDPAARVVDIYIENDAGTLVETLDDVEYRTATGFLELPADTYEITVAGPNSSGPDDAVVGRFGGNSLTDGTDYTIIANGVVNTGDFQSNPDGADIAFGLDIATGARETASSTDGDVEIRAAHGVTDAPTVDIIEGGTTLVDNASYTDITGYLGATAGTFTLRVTGESGTPTLYTFEVDLSGFADTPLTVLASGFDTPGDESASPLAPFTLLAVAPDGTVLDLGAARAQVIHNSGDPDARVVDIYVDGQLTLDDFEYRSASPFIDLDSGVREIAVAPGNSTGPGDAITTFTEVVPTNGSLSILANGVLSPGDFQSNPDGNSTAFDLDIATGAREAANTADGDVEVRAAHGATDAPTVDVRDGNNNVLVDDASYPGITGYIGAPAQSGVTLDVTNSDGSTTFASFTVDLSGFADTPLTVLASGFASTDNENTDMGDDRPVAPLTLLAIAPDGTVLDLGGGEAQVVHNAADPNAGSVDIYIDGEKPSALDGLSFREATGFLPVDSGVHDIAVAPGNSTGPGDAITTFTRVIPTNGSVALIANGVLDPNQFEDNPSGEATAFTLLTETGVRQSPQTSGNVEFFVVHGATDAPAVDAFVPGGPTLADDAAYTDATNYVSVATGTYPVSVTGPNRTISLATFTAPLTSAGTAIVVASGFYTPYNDPSGGNQTEPAFGLLAAFADGSTTLLPVQNELAINEFLADPTSSGGGVDANGDGTVDASGDEFVEIVNRSGSAVDLSGYRILDSDGNQYTFPSNTTIPAGDAATIFGGGTPTGIPGVTDTGLPALNNGGDDIVLEDDQGNVVQSLTYPVSGAVPTSEGVSTARNVNAVGGFAPQDAFGVQASASPGQNNDSGQALPVELAGFAARLDGSDAVLTWRTLSERNNSGFEVQHRAGEEDAFEQIGFREGQGSTSEATAYRFRVADLRPGAHDFRLKQVDVDGSTSLTDVVTVEVALDEAFAWTRVAPNPVAGTGTLSMQVRETQEVTVELYDLLGRRVRTVHNGALQSGHRHQMALDAGGLAGGAYLLRADGENFSDTQRVMIVK